jgi:ribonucleotide reductase beta subunit family protein with ferritin-like domain
MYPTKAAMWTVEEIDLSKMNIGIKLSNDERYFIKNILAFLPLQMVL